MIGFDCIEDVTAWLEPLGYDAFWDAVTPFYLFDVPERAHCDRTITEGIAPFETVLTVLKSMVRMELTERFGLKHLSTLPPKAALQLVD
jgi:hypothetical protein